MLGPLVRVPAAHRRDPLALRHVLPPRGERFLDLANRRRVLENRVIAGTIGQAHAVDVAFDEAGHDRSAAQVDDPRAGGRGGRACRRPSTNRPFRIDTLLAMVFRASIVWIRPLVSSSVDSGCARLPAAAGGGG